MGSWVEETARRVFEDKLFTAVEIERSSNNACPAYIYTSTSPYYSYEINNDMTVGSRSIVLTYFPVTSFRGFSICKPPP